MSWPYPFSLFPWWMFETLEVNILIAVISAVIVFGFAYLAGRLRTGSDVAVGYTRKIFHFAVFTTAGVFMWHWGYGAVMILGGVAFIFVLVACYRADGFVLYEGIARADDAPHRTYYVIVPFLATAFAGLISVYFFWTFAIVGFFVAGWGDAAGEPIGTAFGKHRVVLPFFGKTSFTRSLEGSAGVFVLSLLACGIATWLAFDWELYKMILVSLAVAVTAVFVEFFSPHGIDNFTVQVFSAGAAAWVATVV